MPVAAGLGVGYAQYGSVVSTSINRMHAPAFKYNLCKWLSQLPHCHTLLTNGCRVLDVGCGLGASTHAIKMGYPNSVVVGVDPDEDSIKDVRVGTGVRVCMHASG
eukprot:TRINITY_DN8124_c0_g1_i6.p4 TRINITY_DN8124_c0_g1~~TRINITY_DN8124_c0_g1_i6.p4  ORF type:complete len:105 (+),score=7.53 TRINITY_DN8124_c0_g1_i6:523-837(+)